MTLVHVERRSLDVIHAPGIAKDRPDLGLGDPARSPNAGLSVAEAHQEIGAAEANHSPEAIAETVTVFVREYVKQPGVNDGIELLFRYRQVECVGDIELSRKT